jgi:hypothetical protein
VYHWKRELTEASALRDLFVIVLVRTGILNPNKTPGTHPFFFNDKVYQMMKAGKPAPIKIA